MLAGLTSRWTSPRSWASPSEWQAWRSRSTTRSGGTGPIAADQRLQVQPVEQLHHEVERAGPGLAEVVQPDRMRRLQLGRRLGLALEPSDDGGRCVVGGRAQDLGLDQLDRGGPGEHPVRRAPHLAHAAAPDELHQPVASELARPLHLAAESHHDLGRDDGDERAHVVGEIVPQDQREGRASRAPGGAPPAARGDPSRPRSVRR